MATDVIKTKFEVDTTALKKVEQKVKDIDKAFFNASTAVSRMNFVSKNMSEAVGNSAVKAARSTEKAFSSLNKVQEKVNRGYEEQSSALRKIKTELNQVNHAMVKLSEQSKKESEALKIKEAAVKVSKSAAEAARAEADAKRQSADALKAEAAEIRKNIKLSREYAATKVAVLSNPASTEAEKAAARSLGIKGYGTERQRAEMEAKAAALAKQAGNLSRSATAQGKKASGLETIAASDKASYDSLAAINKATSASFDKLRKQFQELEKQESILNTKRKGTMAEMTELSKAEKKIIAEKVAETKRLNSEEVNRISTTKTKGLKTFEDIGNAQKEINANQSKVYQSLQKQTAAYSAISKKLQDTTISESGRQKLLLREKVVREQINGLMDQNKVLNRQNADTQRAYNQELRKEIELHKAKRKVELDRFATYANGKYGVTPLTASSIDSGMRAATRELYQIQGSKSAPGVLDRVSSEYAGYAAKEAALQKKLSSGVVTDLREQEKIRNQILTLQGKQNALTGIQRGLETRITELKEQQGAAGRDAQAAFTRFRQIFFTGLIAFGSVAATLRNIVKEAGEAEKAMKALNRQARLSGIFGDKVTDTVRNLEFVQNGLVSVAEASKAVRNLMRLGFSFDQAVDATKKITEVAVENKQAALTLGQAVVSTTEGFRQELSVLADAGGITKNLSVIYAEFAATLGKTEKSLTRQEKNMALIAEINREATISAGALDSVMNTLAGSSDAAAGAFVILSQELGFALKPQLVSMYKFIVLTVRAIGDFVKTSGSLLPIIVGATSGITALVAGLAALYGASQLLIGVWKGLVAVAGLVMGSMAPLAASAAPFIAAATVLAAASLGAVYALKQYDESLTSVPETMTELANASKDLQTQMDNTIFGFEDMAKRVADTTTPLEAIKKEFMSLEEVQKSAFLQTRVEAAKTKDELMDLYTAINEQRKESIKLQIKEQQLKLSSKKADIDAALSRGVVISESRAKSIAAQTQIHLKSKGRIPLTTEGMRILSGSLSGVVEDEEYMREVLLDAMSTETPRQVVKNTATFRDTFAELKHLFTEGTMKLQEEAAMISIQYMELDKALNESLSGKKSDPKLDFNLNFAPALEKVKNQKKGAEDVLVAKEELLKGIDKTLSDLGRLKNRLDMKDKAVDIDSLISSFTGMRSYLSGDAATIPSDIAINLKKFATVFPGSGESMTKEAEKFYKAVLGTRAAEKAAEKKLLKAEVGSVAQKGVTQKQILRMHTELDTFKDSSVFMYEDNELRAKKALDVLREMPEESEAIKQALELNMQKDTETDEVRKAQLQMQIDNLQFSIDLHKKLSGLIDKEVNSAKRTFVEMQNAANKQDDPEKRKEMLEEAKKSLKSRMEALSVFKELGLVDEELVNALTLQADVEYVAKPKGKTSKLGKGGFGIEGKIREYREYLKDRQKLSEEAAAQDITVEELKLKLHQDIHEEMRQITADTANSMKQSFVDGYMGMLEGTKKFSDAIYDVFKTMLDRLNRLVVERAVEESFIGKMFESISGSITGQYSSGASSNLVAEGIAGGLILGGSGDFNFGPSLDNMVNDRFGISPSMSQSRVTVNVSTMDAGGVFKALQTPEAQAAIQKSVSTAQSKNKLLGGN